MQLDALSAVHFGLSVAELEHLIKNCDLPAGLLNAEKRRLDPRGFWRVDSDMSPELRHTVLTLVASHDLSKKIDECGGDRERGIHEFLSQNDGEGWMLPETLRLADHGLGHDDRATVHQPVASRLGPRFSDWQLTQSAEESWRECQLHARNILGPEASAASVVGGETTVAHPPTGEAQKDAKGPSDGCLRPAPPIGKLF